jgi:uncharacterized protein involved in outer membrane biogenesis
MKWFFKWVFRLAIFLVALLVVLLLSLDSVVKALAERQIRAKTGMEAKIGKFSVGLIAPMVTMDNFKLYNTAEFGGTPFLDIPELHIEYDRAALARHQLHITLMRFKLAELDVVKNEAGRTNIVGLTAISSKTGGGKKLEAEGFEFTGIDVLNLSLGKVRYLDLKDRSQNREWNITLENQVFKNVKTRDDLTGLELLIALRSGGNFPGLPAGIPNPGAARGAVSPLPSKR